MSDDEQDPPEATPEEEGASTDANSMADDVAAGVEEAGGDDDALAAEWAAAMDEAGETGEEEPEVKAAPLEAFDEQDEPPEHEFSPDLDVILDIPVRISMEVGHTHIAIRNLLQLNQGSVVELNRLAGEPLDVLVNGTLIAHGEVVMVNDKFGIRLTDVVSQSERVQKLH
jgi:flagellar motor switch protein FliN/FliY